MEPRASVPVARTSLRGLGRLRSRSRNCVAVPRWSYCIDILGSPRAQIKPGRLRLTGRRHDPVSPFYAATAPARRRDTDAIVNAAGQNRSYICSPPWAGFPTRLRRRLSIMKSRCSRGSWPTSTGTVSEGLRGSRSVPRRRRDPSWYPRPVAARPLNVPPRPRARPVERTSWPALLGAPSAIVVDPAHSSQGKGVLAGVPSRRAAHAQRLQVRHRRERLRQGRKRLAQLRDFRLA